MLNLIPIGLKVGNSTFPFTVSYKRQGLGNLSINQFWMPKNTIYRQPADNSSALIECFWALCLKAYAAGEIELPADRETYLLAHLLPVSFGNLSRQVMPDSPFNGPGGPRKSWDRSVKQLNERLSQSPRTENLSLERFRDLTYAIFGMPELTDEENDLYGRICTDLLTEPAALMDKDTGQAVSLLDLKWNALKAKYYSRRRWISPEAKRIFSVISYECRAAFHECYSDAWIEILREDGPLAMGPHDSHWPQDVQLTPSDLCFLRLWNVLLKSDSNLPDASFHYWRGHILALHPASGLLIDTERGQTIVGGLISAILARGAVPEARDFLQTVRDMPQFHELSHALIDAAEVYVDGRHEVLQRRRDRGSRNVEDVERSGRSIARPLHSPSTTKGPRSRKKDIKDAFEEFATAKRLTCPGKRDCDLIYRRHTSAGQSSPKEVKVTYWCERHGAETTISIPAVTSAKHRRIAARR